MPFVARSWLIFPFDFHGVNLQFVFCFQKGAQKNFHWIHSDVLFVQKKKKKKIFLRANFFLRWVSNFLTFCEGGRGFDQKVEISAFLKFDRLVLTGSCFFRNEFLLLFECHIYFYLIIYLTQEIADLLILFVGGLTWKQRL